MAHLIATLTGPVQSLLAEGGGGSSSGGGGIQTMWIGLILAMVVFWIFMMRGNTREKKQRQAMLDNLADGDRVLTIGGIIGKVVKVKASEVIVKVDESKDLKMTFTRSAIQKVLTEDDQDTTK